VGDIPGLTGNQLIALLVKDGWTRSGQRTHGYALTRRDANGRVRIALVKPTNKTIPDSTLGAILSVKQSGIGRAGLKDMIERHGV